MQSIKPIFFFVLSLCFTSCVAPYGDLQTAETLDEGELEVGANYANYSADPDQQNAQQEQLGLQVAYGLRERLDVRLSYSYLFSAIGGEESHILGIGPKYEIIKDKFSVYWPVGTALDLEGFWQMHPTLLYTVPVVADRFSVTASPKYLWSLDNNTNDAFAANFILEYRTKNDRFAVRGNIGWLYGESEEKSFDFLNRQYTVGFISKFGLGVSAASDEM